MSKYTKELLAPIASKCVSIAQVLRHLGLKEAGGTHSYISKRIKELEIDTSHFFGKGSNCGEHHKGSRKLDWRHFLVLRKTGSRQKAFVLRRSLIAAGFEYKCNGCSLKEWCGRLLFLHVDHKNGNWLDDRKENLRFMCPNCHSQSPKYCGSKGYAELTSCAKQCRERRKQRRHGRVVE